MKSPLATLSVTVALTVAIVFAEPQRQDKRIVHGSPATPYAWPSICSLKEYGRHICGATLLKNTRGVFYLVSAAHCFCQCEDGGRTEWTCDQWTCPLDQGHEAGLRYASALTAHCGVHNLTGDNPSHEQTFYIASITDHENFDPLTVHNDIAVLTLATQPRETHWVQAAALPSSHNEDGDSAIMAGWGNTARGWGGIGGRPSDVLMQTALTVKNDAVCRPVYGYSYDSASMMCAQGTAGRGANCQGDSGGPLYAIDNRLSTHTDRHGQWRLAGVVSFGSICGGPKPGVMADTYRLRNWINQKINN